MVFSSSEPSILPNVHSMPRWITILVTASMTPVVKTPAIPATAKAVNPFAVSMVIEPAPRSVLGMEREVPCGRQVACEPQFVKKGEKPLNGFDDRIRSLGARGMTTEDIQAHFLETEGVEVSAGLIAQVTHAVMDEVNA